MKPRLLDLFCGAGGAAMGYHRAGFEVVGVDIKPQPRYPFEFVQGNALNVLRILGALDVDAIHASPPCQAFSTIAKQRRLMEPGKHDHPDLVEPTRELLRATGLPYVIENVMGAPLEDPIRLCGSSFGLNVRRHRLFECHGFEIGLVPPCAHHWQTPRFRTADKRRTHRMSVVPVNGQGTQTDLASVVKVYGHHDFPNEHALRSWAMEIDWMTPYELTQAIPPAYTEFIGTQLMAHLRASGSELDYEDAGYVGINE